MTYCIEHIHQSQIKIQITTQGRVTFFCCVCESSFLILLSLQGLKHISQESPQSLFPLSNVKIPGGRVGLTHIMLYTLYCLLRQIAHQPITQQQRGEILIVFFYFITRRGRQNEIEYKYINICFFFQ